MEYNQLIKNFQLMEAIKAKNYPAAESALNAGANVNFVDLYNHNITPLQLARSLDAPTIVTLLLLKGASDETKRTPRKRRHSVTHSSPSTSPFSSSETSFYDKRVGTANVGQFYETKLLTLVLLRVLHDASVERFFLGTNLDAAGDFDDIVLRFTKAGQEKVFFLQAKHVRKESVTLTDMMKDPKGAFYLEKYFKSYVKIRTQFNSANQEAIFSGNFEDVEAKFIIFTTTAIDFEGKAISTDVAEGNIFCTNRNVYFSIDNDYFIEEFVKNSADVSVETVRDFFKNLVFCIEQPTEDRIDDMAIAEISKAEGVNAKLPKLKFLKLHDTIQEWWKKGGKVPFLTKKCDFMESVRKAVDHESLIENLHSVSIYRLKSYEILFSSETLGNSEWATELDTFVNNAEKQTMHIVSNCPELTALRILQYLEKHPRFLQNVKFFNENITKQVDVKYIMKAITQIPPTCLILSNRGTNIEQLNGEISEHVAKFIVITDSANVSNFLADNNITLSDLDPTSQGRLLECEVKFQGKLTPLKSLVGSQPSLVNAQTMARLLAGETIAIANPTEDETMRYYIHRKIRRCTFKANILQSDSFFILETSRGETIPENGRDVIVLFNVTNEPSPDYRRAEKYFEKLCTKYATRNIHLLSTKESKHVSMSSEENNEIVWHKSQNDMAQLRKFINANSKNECELRTVEDLQDEVVILAAEPGMGKSTVLTSLSAESIAKGLSAWILRINLLNYSKQFFEWERQNTKLEKNDVLVFLIHVSEQSSKSLSEEFTRSIFLKHCEDRKLILLVDGFDEISPTYKNIVKQLLRICKQSISAKLLVTTQSGGVQTELEDFLGTLAFTLKRFTIEDQEAFLKKFWETKLKIDIDEQRYRSFIKQLFSELSNLIQARQSDLLSVPLQVKMIALTFEEQIKSFCNSNDVKFSLGYNQYKNVKQLYDQFMYIQIYNVHAEDKDGIDLKKPSNEKKIKISYEIMKRKHMLAAVDVLFRMNKKLVLLTNSERNEIEEFQDEVKNGEEKSGIVYQNTAGNLMFIHQTYAEYFAALFISQMYSELTERKFEVFFEAVIEGSLLKENRIQICRILQLQLEESIANIKDSKAKSYRLLKSLMNAIVDLANLFVDHAAKELLSLVEYTIDDNECQIAELIIKQKPKQKMSLLLAASIVGCNKLLGLTCRQQVDVNKPYKGNFALFMAVDRNNLSTVQLLLDNGTDVKVRCSVDGETPLHRATWNDSREVAKLLLAKGADVNDCRSDNGVTPLHLAAQEGFREFAQLLIDNGANLNACSSNYGVTPLHLAAQKCFPDIAELLISNGAILDAKLACNGETPLHTATWYDSKEVAKLLLAKGADVNRCANRFGETPLHCAAQQNFREFAKLLLENGAILDAKRTYDGDTPLHRAAWNDSKEVAELLLAKGTDVNACRTENGTTPLHLATQKGFREIAELLIENGAILDVKRISDGETPLHGATRRNSKEVTRLLLSKGADVNARCSINGATSLHLAAQEGFREIAALLIENGADVNVRRSIDNATPLQLASTQGFTDLASLLHENNAEFCP